MDVNDYKQLLPLIFLGLAFFSVSVSMLYWSAKTGGLRRFDRQARTIFTDEEPEGEVSDTFPSKW